MNRRELVLGIISLPVGLYCMAHDMRMPRMFRVFNDPMTMQGYKITAKGYRWQ